MQLSEVGAFATGQANLTAVDRPRRVNTGIVSAGLFKVLGVNPMLGRAFEVSETIPNGPQGRDAVVRNVAIRVRRKRDPRARTTSIMGIPQNVKTFPFWQTSV